MYALLLFLCVLVPSNLKTIDISHKFYATYWKLLVDKKMKNFTFFQSVVIHILLKSM